jgi:endo-1,4-beta-xylanase
MTGLRFPARCHCLAVLVLSTLAISHAAAAPPLPSLAEAYQGRLKIGAAVEAPQLRGADGALLASQFNSVVAENAMKPAALQPTEGRFNFGPADAIVAYAQQHRMAVRGHTLLWFKRTPDWFWTGADGSPASRDQVLARLQRHIETVVGRYKGKVYAWDVVNEVIDASQPDCLRNDRWRQVVGPGYIAAAFRYAHAADPRARLFINDYATHEPAKRDCLVRIVKPGGRRRAGARHRPPDAHQYLLAIGRRGRQVADGVRATRPRKPDHGTGYEPVPPQGFRSDGIGG